MGDDRDAAANGKMNTVDPQAWLTQTLVRLANGWPSSDIHALMPWNYMA
jgi:transposase